MPKRASTAGSELFIVDNTDDDWKVSKYLHEWCGISKAIDIATGYFEIGSLLALGDEWQKVDHIRILMGDEVSLRTRRAFEKGLALVAAQLDASMEQEKAKNAFLKGVDAIADAIRAKKIECRVYRKDKFHAKAYITHARMDVVGSFALVGSSNFTYPGLTQNIELNVQISGTPVSVLQEWYEDHWKEAEDVSVELLKVIDRQIAEYRPFEVYAKALSEYFRGHEATEAEWERTQSVIYPLLSPYQREGYHALLKKGTKYRGAFLCDGVGLGKTYVGLMLIERLIMHDRLNVALFVPKAARAPVWESTIKRRLPHLFGKYTQLAIFNHTDLLRGGQVAEDLESVAARAHVILIDEAHHFRNTGTKGDPEDPQSRYWKLYQLAEGKTMYLLTATPINNSLLDLQHMIELFSRRQSDYFKDAPLGIHSLPGHFRVMDKALEKLVRGNGVPQADGAPPAEGAETETNLVEAEQVLIGDDLFKALVVQRSRAYVKESADQEGGNGVLFPQPREPKVQPYSVKQTYGKLLKMVEEAFSKKDPLFALPIYYPLAYYKGSDADIDPLVQGRQRQVVSLIRIGFLKRFESSVEAFRMSCWNLLRKLLAWLEVHAETSSELKVLERWKRQHKDLIGFMQDHQADLFGDGDEAEADEDLISPEMLEAVEKLDRSDYRIGDIIDETILDLNQLAAFLKELEKFEPKQDKKLQALKTLLASDPVLKSHKVLIFTEFMNTARYLRRELEEAGVDGVAEIDSGYKGDRGDVIRRFAPYYNGTTSAGLEAAGQREIRVLISTDVLSEGLNLQDATRLINYDLHWNPVRLMQRIGRVDRRMDPAIEAQIVADHPDQKKLRGEVAYWNFLPPEELDELLRLYTTVSRKTLKISKTFGIEGRKLLTPQDEFDALREFAEKYEGTVTSLEAMHLELQKLLKDDPELEARLRLLPGQVFSGKRHPSPGTHAMFFCYALPGQAKVDATDPATQESEWSFENGTVQWYLFDLASAEIVEDATRIIAAIRCVPDTPRHCEVPPATLAEIRDKLDTHVKNTYLKQVQAPANVRAELRAWMELN